jgi:hypothetical protein
MTVDLPGNIDIEHVRDGRDDIEVRDGAVADFSFGLVRKLHEERDLQDVGRIAFAQGPFRHAGPERLAVVRRDDDEGLVVLAGLLELSDQVADQLVHVARLQKKALVLQPNEVFVVGPHGIGQRALFESSRIGLSVRKVYVRGMRQEDVEKVQRPVAALDPREKRRIGLRAGDRLPLVDVAMVPALRIGIPVLRLAAGRKAVPARVDRREQNGCVARPQQGVKIDDGQIGRHQPEIETALLSTVGLAAQGLRAQFRDGLQDVEAIAGAQPREQVVRIACRRWRNAVLGRGDAREDGGHRLDGRRIDGRRPPEPPGVPGQRREVREADRIDLLPLVQEARDVELVEEHDDHGRRRRDASGSGCLGFGPENARDRREGDQMDRKEQGERAGDRAEPPDRRRSRVKACDGQARGEAQAERRVWRQAGDPVERSQRGRSDEHRDQADVHALLDPRARQSCDRLDADQNQRQPEGYDGDQKQNLEPAGPVSHEELGVLGKQVIERLRHRKAAQGEEMQGMDDEWSLRQDKPPGSHAHSNSHARSGSRDAILEPSPNPGIFSCRIAVPQNRGPLCVHGTLFCRLALCEEPAPTSSRHALALWCRMAFGKEPVPTSSRHAQWRSYRNSVRPLFETMVRLTIRA